MAYSSTRELAQKLGAIENIYANRDATNQQNSQPFDYLLVLDFEATCFPYPEGKTHENEIIEFPVVMYDVKKAEIVEEFQQYVAPTEHPVLSEFCINLTGITQTQVNNGVPLGTCLMFFNKWLSNQIKKYNMSFPSGLMMPGRKKCVFVTWSDWDLKTCLSKECKRKGINKNEAFSKWIDLRAVYMEFYYRKPTNLGGALEEVGLRFEGRQHCGLHDARNTAYLARKMISDGAVLKITKDITGQYF